MSARIREKKHRRSVVVRDVWDDRTRSIDIARSSWSAYSAFFFSSSSSRS